MKQEFQAPTEELLRRLAEAGPGFQGRRKTPSDEELLQLRAEAAEAGLSIPAFLEGCFAWVDREAKLFEAGDYPDKGVSILPADIERLARGFGAPVPVLIEHSESPLEIGYLTAVRAEGNDLFGTIALTEEANALIERSGAKSLSIGLSRDMGEIREVSLVRSPRVASARLFSAPIVFEGSLGASESIDWHRQFESLRSRVKHEESRRKIDELVASGKLSPAQAPFAEAILKVEESVQFDGQSQPLAQLLIAMIERQPPMALFKELAPGHTSARPPTMLPEEADFYRRHFPDVDLDTIAAVRRASA